MHRFFFVMGIGSFVLLSATMACSGKSDPNNPTAASTVADAGGDGALPCPPRYAECDRNPNTICESHLDADPLNCGACGKVCAAAAAHQASSCKAGACESSCEAGFIDCDHDPSNGCESPTSLCGVVVLADLVNPMGLAVDDAFVYYGSRGTGPDYVDGVLYKVPKDGSGKPIVLASNLNQPLNLAVDDTRVYWSNGGHGDQSDGSIASVSKTGGGVVTTIASTMMRPNNPVLAGDKIYWTTRTKPTGFVYSAHKDGSDAAPTLVASSLLFPSAMELADSSFLIWSTEGTPGGDGTDALVERANLDGTNRTTLAKGILIPNYRLGIGADAVFVGSLKDNSVRRIPFVGGPSTTIASGVGNPHEIWVEDTSVFITTAFLRRVLVVPTMGGAAPIVLADEQVFPSYIAVDANYVYFTDGKLTEGTATIRKTKKPGK